MKVVSKPNFKLLDEITRQEMSSLKGGSSQSEPEKKDVTVTPKFKDVGDVGVGVGVPIG